MFTGPYETRALNRQASKVPVHLLTSSGYAAKASPFTGASFHFEQAQPGVSQGGGGPGVTLRWVAKGWVSRAPENWLSQLLL